MGSTWTRAVWGLLVIYLLAGCYTHSTVRQPLGRTVIVPPDDGEPALEAHLELLADGIEAVVRWRTRCRSVPIQERIETRTPDGVANTMLITLGAAASVTSLAMMVAVGEERVEELRTIVRLTGLGVTLVGGVMIVLPLGALLKEPEQTHVRERLPALAALVPCGSKPVAGLTLRWVNNGRTSARSTTDSRGRARFPAPPPGEGQVEVDQVSESLPSWVQPGQVLAHSSN